MKIFLLKTAYLFKDLKTFFDVSIEAYNMSIEKRTEWEDSLNFMSLQSFYEIAYDEYERLKSYDNYLLWKAKNINNWKFTDVEGEGDFTYPIKRMCDAYAVNAKGKVIIDNHLHDLTKDNDSFYQKIPIYGNLKSANEEQTYCRKTKDKRRVKVNLFYQGTTSLLTVQGYKRYLWDWRSYTTSHAFEILSKNNFRFMPRPITVERNGGPAFFEPMWISNYRFQADGIKLSLRFYTPTVQAPMAAPLLQFKGWTGGVPESYACTVTGYGKVEI